MMLKRQASQVTWHPITIPSGKKTTLYAIGGHGLKTIYMAGKEGTVLLSNGTTAAPQVSGSGHILWSVWSDATAGTYIVGENGTILHKQ